MQSAPVARSPKPKFQWRREKWEFKNGGHNGPRDGGQWKEEKLPSSAMVSTLKRSDVESTK